MATDDKAMGLCSWKNFGFSSASLVAVIDHTHLENKPWTCGIADGC